MKRFLIILIALIILLFTACNHEQPDENTTTISNDTQYDSSENENSTSVPDEWEDNTSVFGGTTTLYNENIDLSALVIKADASPNTDHAYFIDAEDVVEIILGPQDSSFDIEKLSIIGVSHQNMSNPYTTAPKDFISEFRELFKKQGDEYIARFSIGYKTNISDAFNILFIYDGKIEAYTNLLMVFQHKTSVPYWRYMRPIEDVQQFHIQCEDSILDYCFFDRKPTTLFSWHTQDCSLNEWELYEGWLVNKSHEWMIPPEYLQMALTSDCIITAEPFDESKFIPYEYDETNPHYAIYYLEKTVSEVINKFKEPQNVRKFGDVTTIQYPDFTFYLNNDIVVQIDITNGDKLLPINDFIATPSVGMDIYNKCVMLNIDCPDITQSFDDQFSIYQYILPFSHNDWTIAYIWESNEAVNTDSTEFTRVSIYTGNTILF